MKTQWTARCPRIAVVWVRVRAMFQLAALLAADVAEEGKNIVLSMLVVGLIFIGVIAIGQFFKWLGHREH